MKVVEKKAENLPSSNGLAFLLPPLVSLQFVASNESMKGGEGQG